ncbi:MAG: D-glycerate dehydrogenase [Gammaproteobacteria bacterium]|nr:D-glycerate dehydrogenase [Gammaproteobacteria bacterium]
MTIPTITLTRRWPEAVEDRLRVSYRLDLNESDQPMNSDQLASALAKSDALCPTVSDRIDAGLLDGADIRARIIASYGVGFDHIDLATAKKRGIVVTNTPEVLTDCTADLAMTLLLGIARRAGEGERHVRAQAWVGWRPTHMMGAKITGKTLGLVGLGRIGLAVAKRAHFGFGMRVIYFDPAPPPSEVIQAVGAEASDSLESLLAEADFVSLHCPSNEATHHLMNAERFALMRNSAFLINTSRGNVVDCDALVDALGSKQIAGAGLDVYEGEPTVPEALTDFENVMLLPHLGSATLETRIAMGLRVVENLEAFFAGDEPRDRVA